MKDKDTKLIIEAYEQPRADREPRAQSGLAIMSREELFKLIDDDDDDITGYDAHGAFLGIGFALYNDRWSVEFINNHSSMKLMEVGAGDAELDAIFDDDDYE